MCFSLNPHSIYIHSHFHASSLTLSTLCHSSQPSFLHFLFFPILFIISLSPLLIFTLIAFHRITLHITILTITSLHIHLFILTTFHVFSYHLICITLITSHIHLSFIPHHPHSILLPFHHSRIINFSTHPFHHDALRDFLKIHFLSFHLAYPLIHYSILLSILFHLLPPHRHSSLLFILIRIYDLYPFISIKCHLILPLSHFYHTHSYLFPFQHISFHSILSLISYLSFGSSFSHVQLYSVTSLPTLFHLIHSYFHSSILHPTNPIHLFSSLLFFVSPLRDQYHVCSDSCYRMFICCVDRKHFQSIRRNCFCF